MSKKFLMRVPVLALAIMLCGVGLHSTSESSEQKGGEGETGPYEIDSTFQIQPMATRPGYVLGSKGAVFVENNNRIFIANRGELKLPDKLPSTHPEHIYVAPFNGTWGSLDQMATAHERPVEMHNCIIVVDGNGKMVESWTQWDQLFEVHNPKHVSGAPNPHDEGGRGPHSVKISPYDPEHHVWVVDDDAQQVFEFTNDGKKLVMTLGEHNVAGNDDKHFGRPTDIAFLPDGSFWVTDGYENTRIVKFDKNGKFIKAVGMPGKGPAGFWAPHAIDTDRNGHVYVADRDNSRIQVFDSDGKHLDTWPNIFQPYHLMVTADNYVGVIDGVTNKVLKYDLNGKLIYAWGTRGVYPGMIWGVHGFHVDQQGNLIVAEAFGGRMQRFKPKAGADRTQLIGAPPPLMPKSKT